MNDVHYIGFEVRKKTIGFCVKTAAGEIVEEGSVPSERARLRQWAGARPQPWRGAMEATLFSGWIFTFARAAYHLVRRRNLAAAVPAV
jgi:hypothetical protein